MVNIIFNEIKIKFKKLIEELELLTPDNDIAEYKSYVKEKLATLNQIESISTRKDALLIDSIIRSTSRFIDNFKINSNEVNIILDDLNKDSISILERI